MGITMSFLGIGVIAAMESLRREDSRRQSRELSQAMNRVHALAGGASRDN